MVEQVPLLRRFRDGRRAPSSTIGSRPPVVEEVALQLSRNLQREAGTDGPRPVRERAGVPGRGTGVAGGERARRAAAVDGHRRGLGAAPGVGGQAR